MTNTHIESAWPKYPGYQITATPFDGVGRVRHGDLVVAESSRCLVVAESDHRDQLYFPIEDVRWEHFEATDHHTICPFKGEASYWSLTSGGEAVDNVVWTYPEPFDEVADLAGHVAFYADRLDVTVTEEWSDDPVDHVTRRFPYWGSAEDLLGLMDVRPDGDNHFVAPTYPDPPHGTFLEVGRQLTSRNVVEGGQLLGALIVAASKAAPTKRVTSAYATFLRAASFDEPIDVDVDVLRDGRTVAAVEVRMSQGGSLRCAGMALLDAGTEDVLRLASAMPDVAGPHESDYLDMGVVGRHLREVDGSYRRRAGELGPPEVQVWARFRNAPTEQYLHQALLAQATTHWTIGAAMRTSGGMTEAEAHVTVSTGPLSVAIAFHDEADVSGWMLYDNPAIYAGNGSSQGAGQVFAADGRLLASYSVQAMIRPFATPPGDVGGYQRAM